MSVPWLKVGSAAVKTGAAREAGNWLIRKFRRKNAEAASARDTAPEVRPALAVVTVPDKIKRETAELLGANMRRYLGLPALVLDGGMGLSLFTADGRKIAPASASAALLYVEALSLEAWRASALAALADATDAAIALAGGRERDPGMASQIDRLERAAVTVATLEAETPADLRGERDAAISRVGEQAKEIDNLRRLVALGVEGWGRDELIAAEAIAAEVAASAPVVVSGSENPFQSADPRR